MEGGGSVVGWARHGTAPGGITERLINENIERQGERERGRTACCSAILLQFQSFRLWISSCRCFFLCSSLVSVLCDTEQQATRQTQHDTRRVREARPERRGVRSIREEQRRGQGESPAKRRVPYHATYTHRRIWYVCFDSVGLEQGGGSEEAFTSAMRKVNGTWLQTTPGQVSNLGSTGCIHHCRIL